MPEIEIQSTLLELFTEKLQWNGPLPTGALSEHLSSLQLLTLIDAVEERFSIYLQPTEAAEIDTVDQIVATILREAK
ncbi:acyl carrier protein [Pendulispora rubella]|uniref:Acyl carrier protein n=1 Tax=Pendulispora rubella TaxID=2741070 RepID=A0ABZ2LAB7_9BACT